MHIALLVDIWWRSTLVHQIQLVEKSVVSTMAANGLLGRLPEYDLDSDFGEYVERLDQFFLANDMVQIDSGQYF